MAGGELLPCPSNQSITEFTKRMNMNQLLVSLKGYSLRIGIEGSIAIIVSLLAIGFSVFQLLGGTQLNQSYIVVVLGFLLIENVLQRVNMAGIVSSLSEVQQCLSADISLSERRLMDDLSLTQKAIERLNDGLHEEGSADMILRGQAEYESFAARTENAANVVLVGSHLSNLISLNLTSIRSLLRKGCIIDVIIRDPDSSLDNLSQLENIQRTMAALNELRNVAPEQLQIRMLRRNIHHSIVAIDYKRDHGIITVSQYPNTHSIDEMVHFDLHRLKDPRWYGYFVEEIECVLREAHPMEE